MRGLLISAIALGALGLSCNGALAKKVSISGTHSAGQIEATCGNVGGVYAQSRSGYSCTKLCGATGTSNCSVSCNNRGKCTGTVPRGSGSPRTLAGILHPPSKLKAAGGRTSPKHGRHTVAVGGVKPPYAGLKHPSGSYSRRQPSLRVMEHHSGHRHH